MGSIISYCNSATLWKCMVASFTYIIQSLPYLAHITTVPLWTHVHKHLGVSNSTTSICGYLLVQSSLYMLRLQHAAAETCGGCNIQQLPHTAAATCRDSNMQQPQHAAAATWSSRDMQQPRHAETAKCPEARARSSPLAALILICVSYSPF